MELRSCATAGDIATEKFTSSVVASRTRYTDNPSSDRVDISICDTRTAIMSRTHTLDSRHRQLTVLLTWPMPASCSCQPKPVWNSAPLSVRGPLDGERRPPGDVVEEPDRGALVGFGLDARHAQPGAVVGSGDLVAPLGRRAVTAGGPAKGRSRPCRRPLDATCLRLAPPLPGWRAETPDCARQVRVRPSRPNDSSPPAACRPYETPSDFR